jgi:hypothetical protein
MFLHVFASPPRAKTTALTEGCGRLRKVTEAYSRLRTRTWCLPPCAIPRLISCPHSTVLPLIKLVKICVIRVTQKSLKSQIKNPKSKITSLHQGELSRKNCLEALMFGGTVICKVPFTAATLVRMLNQLVRSAEA